MHFVLTLVFAETVRVPLQPVYHKNNKIDLKPAENKVGSYISERILK